ncbi:MAG: FAD-dependent oxidoreductase [Pseudomonadota bacterium]|nr:FAD-dependent oxidoreductase [Gammaproteobacteria bacterium]
MPKKIIVVGGVAGGASAAARARRLSEDTEIILIERDEYISFANCGLPYHIGGTITDRQRLLVQTPSKMQQRFNIDVRIRQEVISIDRAKKNITIFDKNTEHKYTENYDRLILSPGATPFVPPIPGIDHPAIMTLRNMHDMDQINAWISEQKPKKAVVIGGGYIGLEMSEALHQRSIAVTLIEMAPQVMNALDPEMATLLHQELTEKGVKLQLNNAATGFEPIEQGIQVLLKHGNPIQAELVILAIGVKPENQLAKKCGLDIGRCGGVVVNEYMQTSDPNIYAVGDVVEVNHLVSHQQTLLPLAGPANRQGRIAADHIFGRNSRYQQSQGTGICKIFDLTAAMTGMNEKALRASQMEYEKIYLNDNDHAGYYPGATPIELKVLFHPKTGQLLGAQAVGNKGIDKRIDVLALAIRAQLTVFDLEHAELAYAPPYGSAKDIINYAGFVAVNWIRGDSLLCHVQDVLDKDEQTMLLDIRTKTEYKNGTIPNAINIPLNKLREQIDQLDKSKKIIVFCKSGLRAHIACRILMQKGFDCRNLSGGYGTYMLVTEAYQKDPNKPIPPATKAMASKSAG